MSDITDRKYLERNRGLQANTFIDLLKKAGVSHASETEHESVNPPHSDMWPRNGGSSDQGDPYGSQIKPKGVPVWDHPPIGPEEEAIYYGNHIHSESNPLGLHSHIKGGKSGGGHSHGPQNRFGAHHHRVDKPEITMVDGNHSHGGKNYPDGCHEHMPENFG